ncbi:xylosidase/arabinosidase [bacterium]|nr:xylosidase/arabinosidase [bacterium]
MGYPTIRYAIIFALALFLLLPGFVIDGLASSTREVDTTTLTGKVMCGYQGWFSCEGDGMERGWFHYGKRGQFKPGMCTIDFWPDVRELDEDEKYQTPFKHKDGSPAYVFSSANRKTVLRHFQWMRESGIDGVFVQRFATQTLKPKNRRQCDTVLKHCREGAKQHGRAYAVMYDLSGMRDNQMDRVIDDWKRLLDGMQLYKDQSDTSYLHHNGKPVVAVWGLGFNDGREYTLKECGQLIDFLKNDPVYGGCTVMLGVPTYWRALKRDCISDPLLHDIIRKADIVSPWMVGRLRCLEDVEHHAQTTLREDRKWCLKHDLTYLPVVYPGFSWHNMKPKSPLNRIPRLKGRFLWKQFTEYKKAGATMIYQAMFDEMDEGTAIFKCTNNPPVGKSPFLTYEGLPSDFYLRLVGMGGRLIRDEIPLTEDLQAALNVR